MPDATWLIGDLSVRFTGDVSVFADTIARRPSPPTALGSPISVSVNLQTANDWPTGISQSATLHHKGWPNHRTSVNFTERSLHFQLVSPVSATTQYLLYRDLFCGLGGLAGDPLLHASAVVHNGHVHAFLAESGGGKSTIANLLRPHAAWLNDEIIWVRMIKGKPMVVNQAFWRGEDSCGDAPFLPLAAVYLIHKAKRCRSRALTPSDLFAMALAAPYGEVDPKLGSRAEGTAAMLQAVRCRKLDVPLDGAAIAREIFSASSAPSA